MVKTKIYASRIEYAKRSEDEELLESLGISKNKEDDVKVDAYIADAYIDETRIMCLFQMSDDSKDWIVSMTDQVDIKIPASSVEDIIKALNVK